MIDRYFIGTSTRTSAEVEGLPIVKVEQVMEFGGGAQNVAANLSALGANVILVASEPFPIKNRVECGGVQIARFDQDDQCQPTNLEDVQGLVSKIRFDGIVVSDYGKGAITKPLRLALLKEAVTNSIPVFVNTKGNPNDWIDYEWVPEVVFVCNGIEFEQWSDAYRRASQVIVTKGGDGVVRLSKNTETGSYRALTPPSQVVSVNGAGDTFLSAYTYSSLTDYPQPLWFANAASAVVVRKPYTATASQTEILSLLAPTAS